MPASPTVAVLVGSLRRESINRQYAQALGRLAQGRLAFTLLDLDLPLYNEDRWSDPPAGVLALKQGVADADAVLLVTPEYNRSFTPAIKNALDWGSRPYGHSCWGGKPAAITGTTGGAIGTAVAQHALRPVALTLGMALLPKEEVYLTWKGEQMLDGDGGFADEKTRAFLSGFIDSFAAWIARTGKAA